MRRYLLASVVAAALLPVLAIASPASAATSTVTVFDHQSHFRMTSGGGFTFNGTMHADGRHGTVVGHVKVDCEPAGGKLLTCDATATFAGIDGAGQIFVSGTINGNRNHFFLQITGGNGVFTGATGQVERTGLGGNLELLEFHLK